MLTRSGLGAIVTAVALTALGIVWRYEELVVAAIGIGLVVLMAILIARRPPRAKIERRLTTVRVPRGDPIRIVYRARNDTTYRSARSTLIDRCDVESVELAVDSIPPGALLDIPATIPTSRRGMFEIGPIDVQKVDPFYLAGGNWRNETPRKSFVTVHPKLFALTGSEGSSRIVEDESIVRRAATDPMSGFVSMREYVPGDDPRLVHWPTTARTGTLMIRENVEVRRPEFTVVVDATAGIGTADDFEEAVDVAASLAVHALRSGLDVVVRSNNRDCAGQAIPLRSEGEVLDLLTTVERCDDEAPLGFTALFRQGFEQRSVLLVTGPDGPLGPVSPNDQMLIIRIGEGAQAGGKVSLAARDAADFANRWRSWA